MDRLLLPLKRLFVLIVGVGLAWFSVFTFLPAADKRLPFAAALLLTYCFVAYVGLPAFLRIWQFVHKPTHVPTRTIASDGWAVDPINLVVLARNQKEFIWSMEKAGWRLADELTWRSRIRIILAIVFNRSYPTAPFGSYYVFGRKQDLGFQIQVGKSPKRRHHVRFWQLGTASMQDDHEHHGFWRNLLKRFIRKERAIWVGAAVLDKGLNIRWRNLQLDHGIDSDTTTERDFLVKTLKDAGMLKDSLEIKAGEPLHTHHQGLGETIIADGYVKLCELKRQLLPPPAK